jgi:hypothetical protein
MQHTSDCLQLWARDLNFGVKRFIRSILLMSHSVCLPYQGVVLERMSNPLEGFIFVLSLAAEIASIGHGAATASQKST